MKKYLLATATAFVSFTIICCTSGQTPAESAATVSNLRETICGYITLQAPSTPELEQVRRLCQAGAALKPLAAAYAGCAADVPTTPNKTTTAPDSSMPAIDAQAP